MARKVSLTWGGSENRPRLMSGCGEGGECGTWRVNHQTETKGTGNCRKPGDPRFRDLDMKTGLVKRGLQVTELGGKKPVENR